MHCLIMSWRCPTCGSENSSLELRCTICGSYNPQAPTIRLERRTKVVVVVEEIGIEKLKGMRYELDLRSNNGSLTIGRAPDNNIVLPDPTVSRRHVRITSTPSGLMVEDLGSTNGTYLILGDSAVRITSPTRVKGEAVLQLGNARLRLIANEQ